MVVTQKMVAGKLGLSQRAVAFALNDSQHAQRQLRPETRQRVIEKAREMGYVPHRAARRLARQRGGSRSVSFDQVGVVSLVTGSDPVRNAITDGAEDELSRHAASLTLVRISRSEDWEKVDRLTRAGGVDGWLLYGPIDDAIIERWFGGGGPNKLPFVIVGDHRCTRPVHCVRIDNEVGGRLAAEHFAQRGHRRVAYLMGNPIHQYSREMLAGFRAAAKEFGLDQDPGLILDLPKWAGSSGRPFLESLARMDPKPTALFASETRFAIDMWRVLTGAGLAVPEDFGILGYELSDSHSTNPGVSRIELPTDQIGKHGATLLHQLVLEPSLPPQDLLIKPVCVDNGSVRAAGKGDGRRITTNLERERS